MNSGLVSVVVPSYNYASYLDGRIESILNQTYKNIEVIIIDDCSPDNSVEVLQKYASNPRVTLVAKDKNSGWISTNNQGVELAKGEFVLFAQCDDTCELTMVERLVEAMHKHPSAGISFCRSLLVNDSGDSLGEDFDGREEAFKDLCMNNILLNKWQMARFLFNACVIPNLSAVLIRKECFGVVGNFSHDYRVCSDWEWYFRVVEHYDVAYICSPLNYFMQHDATIRSSTKERIVFEEYIRLLLSSLKKINLTYMERCRARIRVMTLWSEHLLPPSLASMTNFPYHLSCVLRLDAVTVIFLPLTLVFRAFSLFRKVIRKVSGL